MDVLRPSGRQFADREIAGTQAQTGYTARVLILHGHQAALPIGWQHRGLRSHAVRIVTERLVKGGFLSDRAIDQIRFLRGARQTDTIGLDSIELEIKDLATNATTNKTIPFSGTVPTTAGAPSALLQLDTVNSVNVPDIFLNTAASGGSVQIKSTLKNHGYVVAQNTTTAKLAGNLPVRVLFVPIMHVGFSASDLNTMEANVTKDLGPLTYRLMPQGLVQWYWSDDVLTSGSVDIGNILKLYEAGHAMDTVRKNWNKTHSLSQVVVAFGVVDGQIASGSADGQAFWPDLSSILNHTVLVPFEALCGLANTLVNIFTFGLAGNVCNVDIPLYVGWARGDRVDSSALIAHEMGHISDLVKPDALNGSWTNNFSHSVNDEIVDGERCRKHRVVVAPPDDLAAACALAGGTTTNNDRIAAIPAHLRAIVFFVIPICPFLSPHVWSAIACCSGCPRPPASTERHDRRCSQGTSRTSCQLTGRGFAS